MSLAVVGIRVELGGVEILRGVDLEVGDEEVVAVLGPSGSGKTTLLRVIAGLTKPSGGRVLLDGRDVTEVPPHRRGVGLMFQDHALFPHRDVWGNVAFGLRMARMPRTEMRSRVDEVLELVGLAGFAPRRVDGLSGGERQRVALARALAPRPSVLLLDEPLGSLDRALRDRLLEELTEVLAASRVTVLHVTHDQAEAFATGDRVVVMRRGEVAQVGRPDEIWRRPVDAEVARIVGPATLVPVDVAADGTVTAPWGPVAVDADGRRGAAQLLLRPDTLVVASPRESRPTIQGVVTGRVFRGDHVLARVLVRSLDDEGIEVAVADRAGEVPEAGHPVELVLLPGAVLVAAPGGRSGA